MKPRYRHFLMVTTALTSVVLLAPERAHASCQAVSTDTTISDSSVSCVTWTGGNISVSNAGTISGHGTAIQNNGGVVGTISNAGLISGNSVGILTFAVEMISNTGLISGNSGGILNFFELGTISNAGTISGTNQGILNYGGTIGTITNSGTITGNTGITNNGTIAIIENGGAGTISGGNTGIDSSGTIGTISNSGTIIGTKDGVDNNLGTVVLIANSIGGLINGNTAGIHNSGSIGTIINNGTVTNNVIGLSNAAIANSGNIGTITNSGLISGAPGSGSPIYNNSGTIVDIINMSGGTISAASNPAFYVGGGLLVAITNDAGALISSGTTGISNNSSIGTISNSGTITGARTGIYNSGTIGLITNSGTISSTGTNGHGIYNGGTIGTITNNGTISSSNTDIFNGGSIGTITNSGLISGINGGIGNAGTITAISNSGTISSGGSGIYNNDTIGSISNSGTIGGGYTGISNGSSIGTISNSGTISGSGSGIFSSGGTITLIENAVGGLISGNGSGINGGGTIGTITNSGTISGSVGISTLGMIGTISNSGTISGTNDGIYSGGTITLIENVTGGLISGNVIGIRNHHLGSIGTISNSGTISGANTGIYNDVSIGTISNSGLIEAPNAINIGTYNGQIGTILSALSNSGTIAGNINVDQALTITGGSVGALGTLTGYNGTIGTITTNAHDLTFDSAAYQLLDDDVVVGASNTVFNNGLIRVNTTHSITGNYNQAPTATLVVGVTDASHYGQLIISGAATMTGSNVLIAPTSGSLTNGETFTIVQAATAGSSYSGVTATATGFTATTSSIVSGGIDDLIVSLSSGGSGGSGGDSGGRPTPATYMTVGQTAGSNGASVGTALDQIQTLVASGGDASVAPILTALNSIGANQGAAAEGAAIKQLAPGQLSAGVAANNLTATQIMNAVGQHQTTLLEQQGGGSTGRAAGSEYRSGIFWMQLDGGLAVQNSSGAGDGYRQSFYGMTFGVDDHITRNATLGVAFTWARSAASGSESLNGDTLTTSTPELSGYGTYWMGPAYIDGMLGIGYNMFNQTRTIDFLGASASSSYGGMQYMGSVETGYDIPVTPRTTMTPLIGFQASRTDTDGYTEAGAGAADTTVGRQIIDSYATSLGGRVTTEIPTGLGALTPEVKLIWVHDLANGPISTNASLAGVRFVTSTPRTVPDSAQLSLAATLQRTDNVSLRAEYDGDLRTDYQSHTGMLKAEYRF